MTVTPEEQFYVPGPVEAKTVGELQAYVVRELEEIAAAMGVSRNVAQTVPQDALPVNPSNGMHAYFNAGVAGPAAGFYGYEAGSWVKL